MSSTDKPTMGTMESLSRDLVGGAVEVVDLSYPLNGKFPYFEMPEELGLANQPGFEYHEISNYDERGPDWRWGWFKTGEHVGTHFDAPTHWITGQEGDDVASVPASRLVGPALVINRATESAEDPDYLLTVDDVRAFQHEHNVTLEGAWLILRTGWADRIDDARKYLNVESGQQHTPGIDGECAQWLAAETAILGVGVETIGIDAGISGGWDPAFPVHHYFLGSDKYGLAQLANVDRLPPVGAILIAAPLRIPGGTGSPARVLALVPKSR